MPNTAPNKKIIHVAVGVLLIDNKILLAKRLESAHQGGLWEFPGGKVESGEDVQSALIREFKEEVAVTISADKIEPLLEVEHDYGDKCVLLDVWLCNEFSGEPKGLEGQKVCWVAVDEIENYEFPKANLAIVKKIQTL